MDEDGDLAVLQVLSDDVGDEQFLGASSSSG
jgi:hypothetical protein